MSMRTLAQISSTHIKSGAVCVSIIPEGGLTESCRQELTGQPAEPSQRETLYKNNIRWRVIEEDLRPSYTYIHVCVHRHMYSPTSTHVTHITPGISSTSSSLHLPHTNQQSSLLLECQSEWTPYSHLHWVLYCDDYGEKGQALEYRCEQDAQDQILHTLTSVCTLRPPVVLLGICPSALLWRCK